MPLYYRRKSLYPQGGYMRWKSRCKQIETLKARFKGQRWHPSFPDLSVEQRTSPTSDIISNITYGKGVPKGAATFPVGHNHKQGCELITPAMIAGGNLEFMGGKKT